MITNFVFEEEKRRTWTFGELEYSSPETLGGEDFAEFTQQLMRAVIESPLGKNAPNEKADPDAFAKWFGSVFEEFGTRYKKVLYLIIADTVLRPEKGAPPIAEIYDKVRNTPEGIANFMTLSVFFSSNVPNSTIAAQSLRRNGNSTANTSTASPSRTIARKPTRKASLSRKSHKRTTSKTT